MISCRLTHASITRPRVLGGVGLWIALASGCGGGDGGSPAAPVATVTVTPNPVELEVDSTVQLTATLEDAADGNELSGRTVNWSSDATSTATVDANGLVTGTAAGAANITAASEGKSGKTVLTVFADPGSPSGFRVLVGPGGKEPDPRLTKWDRDGRTWDAIEDFIHAISPAAAVNFDRATGTFSPTGDMTVSRANHSAIALNDGRVLVLGGNGRNSAEVYDSASGTFSPVAIWRSSTDSAGGQASGREGAGLGGRRWGHSAHGHRRDL